MTYNSIFFFLNVLPSHLFLADFLLSWTFCFLPLEFFFYIRQILACAFLGEGEWGVGQIPLPAWKSCSPPPGLTSCRLSHEQLGNTWNSQSCREPQHLPNGGKNWNESAVWKASTLSSEISSTTVHKARQWRTAWVGWGFRLPPFPSSDLWEQHSQRLWGTGWVHCPTSRCSEIPWVHRSQHIILKPSQAPAHAASTCHYLFQYSGIRLLGGHCARLQAPRSREVPAEMWFYLWKWVAAQHPATWCLGEMGASYLHPSEVPALF